MENLIEKWIKGIKRKHNEERLNDIHRSFYITEKENRIWLMCGDLAVDSFSSTDKIDLIHKKLSAVRNNAKEFFLKTEI